MRARRDGDGSPGTFPSAAPRNGRSSAGMRVAIFQPYYQIVGGTEKNLVRVAAELERAGHEPVVILPGRGEFTERLDAREIAHHVVRPPEVLDRFGGDHLSMDLATVPRYAAAFARYNVELGRRLRSMRPELFIFNNIRGPFIAGLAPRIAGVPAVLYFQGYFHRSPRFEPLALRWIVHSADRIVSVSDAAFRTAASQMPPRLRRRALDKMHVVYNWLPDQPAVRRDGRRDDDATIRIGTLSTIRPLKGIHHLLDIAERLRDDGVDATIDVAGSVWDEAYHARLRRRIAQRGLDDHFRFRGFVDADAFLAGLDIFVLASRREGFPLALLEALHAGLPIVAFDADGVAEALDDGRAGRIVPVGDTTSMYRRLRALADDPDRRATLAARARDRSRVFARSRQVDKLLEVLTTTARH